MPNAMYYQKMYNRGFNLYNETLQLFSVGFIHHFQVSPEPKPVTSGSLERYICNTDIQADFKGRVTSFHQKKKKLLLG